MSASHHTCYAYLGSFLSDLPRHIMTLAVQQQAWFLCLLRVGMWLSPPLLHFPSLLLHRLHHAALVAQFLVDGLHDTILVAFFLASWPTSQTARPSSVFPIDFQQLSSDRYVQISHFSASPPNLLRSCNVLWLRLRWYSWSDYYRSLLTLSSNILGVIFHQQ